MTLDTLKTMLVQPLSPFFGAVLILTGLYSLTFNAADAKRLRHPRAKTAATIGGWCYILAGGVLIVWRMLS